MSKQPMISLEQRVRILEEKMKEVERFIIEHVEREKWEIFYKKFPSLARDFMIEREKRLK